MIELFEKLPEVGDQEKPKLVFFFDEAHLQFNDLPSVVQGRIEQVVRLIRSKGVGVFFVTQNPINVPDTVLSQLGNRVQHALRAFSPRDQKAVKAAAQTFRTKPKIDVKSVITQRSEGEALVSFLDEKSIAGIVQRAMIMPPYSQIGPITLDQWAAVIQSSVVAGTYETIVDRESVYERLKRKVEASSVPPTAGNIANPDCSFWFRLVRKLGGSEDCVGWRVWFGWIASGRYANAGSTVGRQIVRGIMGSLLGGSKR